MVTWRQSRLTEPCGCGGLVQAEGWDKETQRAVRRPFRWEQTRIGLKFTAGWNLPLQERRTERCGHGETMVHPALDFLKIFSLLQFKSDRERIGSPSNALGILQLQERQTGRYGDGEETTMANLVLAMLSPVLLLCKLVPEQIGRSFVVDKIPHLQGKATIHCGHGDITQTASWVLGTQPIAHHQYRLEPTQIGTCLVLVQIIP